MSEPFALPPDPLAEHASPDVQRQAARLAQEAFATSFRLSLEGSAAQRTSTVTQIGGHLNEWAGMTNPDDQVLRRVLLLAGLDQWGLAYAPLFGAKGLTGLAELIEQLRAAFDPATQEVARGHIAILHSEEGAAFDFKVEVRRGVHLALWHSMIASDARDDAFGLLRHLGSLMTALVTEMPTLGWRIVADTLAAIQLQCLTMALATEGLARETTTELFAQLSRDLPADAVESALAHAAQAVRSWQQAQRVTRH